MGMDIDEPLDDDTQEDNCDTGAYDESLPDKVVGDPADTEVPALPPEANSPAPRLTISERVTDDLARSGLTLDDIQGKTLNHFEVKRVLHRAHPSHADGGYSIPYYDLEGKPVMDCKALYLRVRLIGPHNADTPRYLSPGLSTSHPYIPKQLRDTLASSRVGKTLVITEGEKKAVAACKAGIPCVALPGIYNFKSQLNAEKGQLIPDLRDLIRQLHEEGAIEAVVVVYDSNGRPMTKATMPKNAAEFGKGKETHLVGGGKHVLNPDVYKAGRGLALLIRETFNGLPVGVTWVEPQVEAVKGPRGGHTLMLKDKSRGIDDALVAGRVEEIVALVKEATNAAEALYPDAENEGFFPLGSSNRGREVAFWSYHSKNLVMLPVRDLNNIGELSSAVGNTFLEKYFLRMDRQGNTSIDTSRAVRKIVGDCVLAGRFNNEGREFGTGTWLQDDEELVVNTAGSVYLPDGATLDRVATGRKAIYTGEGKHPPPEYRAVSDAEYRAVIKKISDALDQWNYASEVGGDLVLGWMVMTVFLGAMKSRPTLWLVGTRGSGKTHLAKFIKSCLGEYAWHTDMGTESTSAGIRQMLQMSSSPCIMDEMEKDNTDMSFGERSVAAAMSLIRASYTASSDVKKGNVEGTGRSYRVMTSFCCVSIADPSLLPSDLTRIAKIYLKAIQHNGKIGKPPVHMSKEDAEVFFWGTIQRWKQYQAIITEVRDNWLDVAGNGEAREVDTFGVLLAGAFAAQNCPVGEVRYLLDGAVPELMDQIQEAREASQEADLILETLLSLQIDVQRHEADDRGNDRIQREKMVISRVLLAARGRPTGDEALALADVGLKLTTSGEQQYLAIALRHASLTRLFQGTRWRTDGAWTGGLRDADGVIRNHPVSFDGRLKKCTLVPLSVLAIEADPPISVGSVVAFAPPKKGFGASNQRRPEHEAASTQSHPQTGFANLDDGDLDKDDWSSIPF